MFNPFHKVDLEVYPLTVRITNNSVITIGDLHSNPMLLIYFLKHYGVIHLSENHYEELFDTYQQIGMIQNKRIDLFDKEPLDYQLKVRYEHFLKLINQIQFNRVPFKVRLLGDEFADRGECDLFIAKILEKMHENHIDFSILISNHGLAFIACLQFLYLNKYQTPEEMMIEPESMRSFIYFRKLLQQELITTDYLNHFIDNIYYPHLELLDYGISADGDDINIYTHAGMSLTELKNLAIEYGVTWNASTVSALANTLEQMKTVFKTQKLQEIIELLRTIYQIESPPDRLELTQKKLVHTAFWLIIWNRNYYDVSPYQVFGNFYVHNIHGHDSSCPSSNKYYVSLDSPLGKCFLRDNETEYRTLNHWTYKTICRQEYHLEVYRIKQAPTINSLFSMFSMYYMPSLNVKNCMILTGGLMFLFRNKISSVFTLDFIQNIFERLSFDSKSQAKLLKN